MPKSFDSCVGACVEVFALQLVNVGSLKWGFHTFAELVLERRFDICAFTEKWLGDDELLEIHDHTVIRTTAQLFL